MFAKNMAKIMEVINNWVEIFRLSFFPIYMEDKKTFLFFLFRSSWPKKKDIVGIIIIKVIGTIMAFVNPNTPFIGMMVFSNIIKTILAKTNIKETIKREPFLGDLEKLIFSLMLLFVELIIGKRLIISGIIIPKIKAINAFNKEKIIFLFLKIC